MDKPEVAIKSLKRLLRSLRKPALIVIGATILTSLLLNVEFNFIESKLYDFRMRYAVTTDRDTNIVVVTIDDTTSKKLNDFPPLPLSRHSQFLEAMQKTSPKGIGYIVNMHHVDQVNPDDFRTSPKNSTLPTAMSRFMKSVKYFEKQDIPFIMGTPFNVNGEVLPPAPMDKIDHAIAVIHKDGNVFAEDNVTRRALVTLYDRPSFHVVLARKAGLISKSRLPSGTFYVPEVDGAYLLFKYRTPSKNYQSVSFADVIEGKINPSFFNDKLVLVGSLNKENPSSYSRTPFSRKTAVTPKIQIHANILDSVIQDDGLAEAPKMVAAITTFVSTAFVIWCVLSFTPLFGVVATFFLALFFISFGVLLFNGGVWLHQTQTLIGIFLSYYLVVPYRLIREYKARWEYQRKNNLLRQVEELKTNFLSLVTHDLKTPVARIQGLSEVLIHKAGGRLLDRDLQTLNDIISSTDELNHFITSVLELTKVESHELRPKMESKDINQLIERSVTGFKAQARMKKIKISQKLDPLFPAKIDPSLMLKVINNLVDNAIKYSPENSKVEVESKEEGDWIEISVKDHGIGMDAEELSNLFKKFYRAKNKMTALSAGTGLGLYLTKFFVEAHHGLLKVESEKGKGSTFRILLPLNEPESQPVMSGLTRRNLLSGMRKKRQVEAERSNNHA